jgi:hypothetical protein
MKIIIFSASPVNEAFGVGRDEFQDLPLQHVSNKINAVFHKTCKDQ